MSSEHPSPNKPRRLDVNEVFAGLDSDRASGRLARKIRGNAEVVYSGSDSIPGGVVAVYSDGRCVDGTFRDGVFTAL